MLNRSDKTGGAAVACRRLLFALKQENIDVKLLVLDKRTNDEAVQSIGNEKYSFYKGLLNLLLEKIYFRYFEVNKSVRFAFSTSNIGENILPIIKKEKPDIIHLHWINQGFISVTQLNKIMSLGIPIVWTLHDCWAFTGGCHYPSECLGFTEDCGNCLFLRVPKNDDLSFFQLKRKMEIYSKAHIKFVTCSKWLLSIVQQSSILKNASAQVVSNPINIDEFKPFDRKQVRQMLGLKPDKRYLLFGAGNIYEKRKGLKYLFEALDIMYRQQNLDCSQVELLIFGKGVVPENFPFPVTSFSVITDTNLLVSLYNAADAFVLPSLEDNLPNTVMESLACGTPVVGFDAGGVPEMIVNNETGYIAEYANSESLANCLLKILFESDNIKMRESAREFVVSHYHPTLIAKQYINIYRDLLL